MIRVGIISFWHVHAGEYTNEVLQHPDTELAAIWDELPERGERMAAEYKVPFISSLEDMMKRTDIDAVVVNAPTAMHREVMVQAARAGKHIFTEKVIAPTQREASEIIETVRHYGVKLTVSLPRLNDDYTVSIRKLLREDLLGKLTLARVRLSHNGATNAWLPEHFYAKDETAGGAMIDLGCHPMYLVRLFLGMPQRVSAQYGYVTGKQVEDNAVSLLGYDNGAVGIVEAGFVNSHSPFSIELHGTDGTLLFGFPDGKLQLCSSKRGGKWETIALENREPRAFVQWVEHIQSGTEAAENIELGFDLSRLMEASNLSADLSCSVALSELK